MRLLSRRTRRRLIGVVIAVAAVTATLTSAYLAGPPPPRPAALEQESENENPAEPAEWMWLQRANADGTIPPTAYREALAQTRKIEADTRRGSPQLSDVQWRLLGPSNIGGRLID